MLTLAFFAVFTLLLALSCPVGLSMLLSSIVYLSMRGSIDLTIIPERISSGLDSFPLIAIPLYILAGQIMNNSGVTRRIFDFCLAFIGHIKGGLAHINIIGSIIFAGISGSSVADVAGIGTIEIKAMNDAGYKPSYSAALTAASSCIGPIIPPSIIMIIIGVIAEISIGRLFAAGFVPGVLMGLAMMGLIWVHTKTRPHYFPKPTPPMNFQDRVKAIKNGLPSVMAPVIILAGILSGVVTTTEAGVIAVLYAVVLGFLYKELRLGTIPRVIKEAALSTGMVMLVIAGAQIFGWVVTIERIAHTLNSFVQTSVVPTWMVLIMINIGLIIMGCFIEGTAIIMITVPVLLPLIKTLGIDPVHFATFLSVNMMIGLLTPPVGLSVFIASNVAGVEVMEGFKQTLPFTIPILVVLILTTYVPSVSLWLPKLFFD
jgi:tripartite ATP-independent transporter DctM subunit